MQVVRRKLTPDDISPPGTRYDATCDCVQVTPDDGTTWNDAPGLDPRFGDAYRAPALTGGSAQCDAAARMVAYLHNAVDLAIAFDNSVRLAGELFALFSLAVPGLGVIVAIVSLIVDVLLAIGGSVIDEAFSSTVYDDLLCVFLANIDADGQMSDSQLSDIYDAVAAGFDSTVQAVFGTISSGLGPVGWSNAGVKGTETGDCTSCASPWCYTFDFTVNDGGWVQDIRDGGWSATYVPGVGWTGVAFAMAIALPASANVQQYIIECDATSTYTKRWQSAIPGNPGVDVEQIIGEMCGGGAPAGTSWDIPSGQYVAMQAEDYTVSHTVTRVTLGGAGDNPFGADNC